MLRDPVRLPVAVGLKVILIVQLVPAAKLVPQVFVCAKSPVALILLIDNAAVPLLVKVAVWAALVVLTV
jgi:hypothetical protein